MEVVVWNDFTVNYYRKRKEKLALLTFEEKWENKTSILIEDKLAN